MDQEWLRPSLSSRIWSSNGLMLRHTNGLPISSNNIICRHLLRHRTHREWRLPTVTSIQRPRWSSHTEGLILVRRRTCWIRISRPIRAWIIITPDWEDSIHRTARTLRQCSPQANINNVEIYRTAMGGRREINITTTKARAVPEQVPARPLGSSVTHGGKLKEGTDKLPTVQVEGHAGTMKLRQMLKLQRYWRAWATKAFVRP